MSKKWFLILIILLMIPNIYAYPNTLEWEEKASGLIMPPCIDWNPHIIYDFTCSCTEENYCRFSEGMDYFYLNNQSYVWKYDKSWNFVTSFPIDWGQYGYVPLGCRNDDGLPNCEACYNYDWNRFTKILHTNDDYHYILRGCFGPVSGDWNSMYTLYDSDWNYVSNGWWMYRSDIYSKDDFCVKSFFDENRYLTAFKYYGYGNSATRSFDGVTKYIQNTPPPCDMENNVTHFLFLNGNILKFFNYSLDYWSGSYTTPSTDKALAIYTIKNYAGTTIGSHSSIICFDNNCYITTKFFADGENGILLMLFQMDNLNVVGSDVFANEETFIPNSDLGIGTEPIQYFWSAETDENEFDIMFAHENSIYHIVVGIIPAIPEVCQIFDCTQFPPKTQFIQLQMCHFVNWYLCTPFVVMLSFLVVIGIIIFMKFKEAIS